MFKRRSLVHRRPGLSELLATLIMVAITLVAGAAVFGFVNGQAKTSEGQYATSVASNINYLNEHFVIVNVQFPTSAGVCSNGAWTCAQVAVYNTGSATLDINSIIVKNSSDTSTNVPLYVTSTRTETVCEVSTTSTATASTGASVSGVSTTTSTTTIGGTATTTTVANIPTQNAIPVTFTVNIPSGCPSFIQGDSYQLQVLGLYGNSATYQITAAG